MADEWCYEHERHEDSNDRIDFNCSPLFLGAYYQQGLTNRRPFETTIPLDGPVVDWDSHYNDVMDELRKEIESLHREISQMRQRPATPGNVRQQREIDVQRRD